MRELHARDFQGGRKQIIRERRIEELALIVERQLLIEGVAYALRNPAMNLAGKDHRIDHRPAVVNHDVSQDFQIEGQRIEFDDHGVDAVRGGAHRRPEILGRFQAGLGTGLDRPAHRIGACGEFSKPNELPGDTDNRDLAAFDDQIIFRTFEGIACELQSLLSYDTRGFVDRIAGDDGTPAGERSGAPIELICVACDNIDVGDVNAKLVGGDLRKAGEMPLPLRPDPGCDADLAVRLHLDLRAFVGPDAGALDVTRPADTDVTALPAQFWLLALSE